MKKIASAFLILICMFSAMAQTVSPYFADGVVYLKFADSFPLDFKVDKSDRAVAMSEFPFLADVFEKYEVLGMAQTLYLNNNPKLLRTLRVSFAAKEKIDMFIKELTQFSEVEYAEKLPLQQLYANYPNDPLFATNANRWYLDLIYASEVWNDLNVRGTSDVRVAVIDNAVWGAHPDLQLLPENQCSFTMNANYTINTHVGNASPPASVNQDEDCTLNEVLNEGCLSQEWSHGTHCAGLVGALNDNGEGNASIAGGVTLMGVRAADNEPNLNLLYQYEALQWAVQNNAKIISMSFGSPYKMDVAEQVLQTAYDMGVILLAAAGNHALESVYPGVAPNYKSYPACFPCVISVAAINSNGKLASFSEYGEGRADIAAPGGSNSSGQELLSTTFCKTQLWRLRHFGIEGIYYDGMQGTSMACPLTAGLCALMVSVYPDITPAQVKECLQTTATALTSGSNPIDGNGYVNAYSAVLCAKEKNPDPNFVNPNPPYTGNNGGDEPEPTNIAAHACGSAAIFPNPANNSFTIERPAATAQTARIFDLAGKLLKTVNCTETLTNVDVTDFANGIYFVKIENYTQKIIIKK